MKRPRGWRVGRKVGRTIYDERDRLIGMMDTPRLARLVVDRFNAYLTDSAPMLGFVTGIRADGIVEVATHGSIAKPCKPKRPRKGKR